jgi:hypothetical protein
MKRAQLLTLLVGLPAAVLSQACSSSSTGNTDTPDSGYVDPTPHLPLDQLGATISITHDETDTTATANVLLQNQAGVTDVLTTGQIITFGGTAVTPTDGGHYQAQAPSSASYVFKITEPSKGAASTTVQAPSLFTISSPGDGATVSLSGFTAAWVRDTAATVSVTVSLDEDLFGTHKSFKKVLDPNTDPGSYTFTTADLGDFQQGAPLTLTVDKVRTQTGGITLLGSSVTTIDRKHTRALTPGP